MGSPRGNDFRQRHFKTASTVDVFLIASLIAGCASTSTQQRAEHPRFLAGASDTFTGTDRRAAKTSLVSAGTEFYPLIARLRSSLMTDEYMLSLGITRSPETRRSPDEQRNVTVVGSIYAMKKESDNDFHLIVGDQHCGAGDCLLTVEISGIPPEVSNPDRKTLADVRAKFLSHFGGREPGRSRYTLLDPPIHVTLTGSLFFDIDHKAGGVGPAKLRPDTAWEIHPLSDITFEP